MKDIASELVGISFQVFAVQWLKIRNYYVVRETSGHTEYHSVDTLTMSRSVGCKRKKVDIFVLLEKWECSVIHCIAKQQYSNKKFNTGLWGCFAIKLQNKDRKPFTLQAVV